MYKIMCKILNKTFIATIVHGRMHAGGCALLNNCTIPLAPLEMLSLQKEKS